MPELPEVETVRRTLDPYLKDHKILQIELLTPEVFIAPFGPAADDLYLERVRRRGKYLLLDLAPKQTLLVHLRMTGRLLLRERESAPQKHTHIRLHLQSPTGRKVLLDFQDTRRFGRIWLLSRDVDDSLLGGPAGFYRLGIEPLSLQFTPARLGQLLARRQSALKAALLDQTILAGLGNIYVDEALFAARLDPRQPAGSLTRSQTTALHDAIVSILRQAIARQGTTLRDYVDGRNRRGQFQENLMVYGRKGEKCRICQTYLHLTKVCGRTTVYCPACQSGKKRRRSTKNRNR